MSLNSSTTFKVGIKYYGALHLRGLFTNALLQILGGSAAFKYPDVLITYFTFSTI